MFVTSKSIENVKMRLNIECQKTLNWFTENSMVANPSKFQLMFLGINENYDSQKIDIGDKSLYATKEVKLLGVTIIDKDINKI